METRSGTRSCCMYEGRWGPRELTKESKESLSWVHMGSCFFTHPLNERVGLNLSKHLPVQPQWAPETTKATALEWWNAFFLSTPGSQCCWPTNTQVHNPQNHSTMFKDISYSADQADDVRVVGKQSQADSSRYAKLIFVSGYMLSRQKACEVLQAFKSPHIVVEWLCRMSFGWPELFCIQAGPDPADACSSALVRTAPNVSGLRAVAGPRCADANRTKCFWKYY